MKKRLNILLVFALVFSMLTPAFAFAADAELTTEQKFEALKKAGIMEGNAAGEADLEGTMTRGQLAKVLANTYGLELLPGEAVEGFDEPTDSEFYVKGYIQAVVKAGYMEGGPKADGTTGFRPNDEVTLQELAMVLGRTLGLELDEEATVEGKTSKWATASVAAAIEAGLLEASEDFTVDATRAALVVGAYATHLKVEEAKKGEFATKVESVTATNLKDFEVKFDGTVDEETATDKANYSLKSGKTIKSVSLLDSNLVRVTLEGTLANNKADALSVANVKAGDKVVEAKNVEFTTVDNAIPAVHEVKSLGTKSVKVTFTEPVQAPKQANFTLDGKAYFGKVSQTSGRTVVLTPYSTTALAVGEHTLVVSKVNDWAGFTSLNSSHTFTVVEDKDAPTVVEATATLESLTLTFSEDVDAETVLSSKVYWKSGDSKRPAYGTPEQLAGNKFRFDFPNSQGNSLPTGSVVIFVEGVKDYSGNVIATDTKVVVSPVIDQTRPEVKKVEALSSTTIEVTFSKTLDATSATNTDNYSVLNKDSKVISVKDVTLAGKVATVELYSALSTGTNTITIKNVKDDTKLQNTMLDFTGEIVRGDSVKPNIESKVWNNSDLTVVVKFDKKMDVESLASYSNYLVKINGTVRGLSADFAEISVIQDSTAVAIQFAEKLGNTALSFGAGSIEELRILGVKDTAGNLLKQFVDDSGNLVDFVNDSADLDLADYDFASYGATYKAALTDRKTVKISFDKGINEVLTNGITVSGNEIDEIQVNGTSTVTVKLVNNAAADASDVSLTIDPTKIISIAGNTLTGSSLTVDATNTIDLVKPAVNGTAKYVANSATKTIVVPFTEELAYITGANNVLAANDFKVTRVSDNKVLSAGTDFTADITADAFSNDTQVTITIVATDATVDGSLYRVEVLSSAQYIVDLSYAENTLTATSTRETDSKIDEVDPTVDAALVYVNDTTVKVVFSEKVDRTLAETETNYTLGGTSHTGNPSLAVLAADGKTVTLTIGTMASLVTGNTVTVTVANVTDVTGNIVDAANDVATYTK